MHVLIFYLKIWESNILKKASNFKEGNNKSTEYKMLYTIYQCKE